METSATILTIELRGMSERKQTVLDILRESDGFVSGEAISNRLGISRNAVHKHVNSLRKRGYQIVGISRRGYCLEKVPDRLDMPRVAHLTRDCALGHAFRHYDEIGSTNSEAKTAAIEGAPEGTVVVAERQSAGRGRLGRTWSSPTGKGLLVSLILRPLIDMADAHLFTLVAATALAEALEQQGGVSVAIKWPNDLYVADKKLGGILTEVAGQQDLVDWIVLGVGLNVNTTFVDLPVQLRKSATSLAMESGQSVDRDELLAELLKALERSYVRACTDGFDEALAVFRSRDYLLDRDLCVQTQDGRICGRGAGIDDRGALLINVADRGIRRVHAGEVTLSPA